MSLSLTAVTQPAPKIWHKYGTIFQETKWIRADSGIRYRECSTRKNGRLPDRYYVVRYTVDGSQKQEALGWASEGITLEKARLVLAKLKEANRTGCGPRTLDEHRKKAKIRKEISLAKENEIKQQKISIELFWRKNYWPAQGHKADGSLIAEKSLWRKWLKPKIGIIPVVDLEPTHLERIKGDMIKANMAPATIKYAMALVSQVWTMAYRDGLVKSESPTKKVILPKIDNARQRYLDRKEIDLLLKKLFEKSKLCYYMAILALDCGLRFGEIANLRWIGCNFERKQILILDPKAKQNRYAFMTDRVKSSLEEWKILMEIKSEFIFPNSKGEIFSRTPKVFSRVATSLFNEGVSDKRQRVYFHTLRHTFASRLVEGGVSIYVVKELLGHSDIKMTQRYSHLSYSSLENAISKLSQ